MSEPNSSGISKHKVLIKLQIMMEELVKYRAHVFWNGTDWACIVAVFICFAHLYDLNVTIQANCIVAVFICFAHTL
jgi:hypothetical protein